MIRTHGLCVSSAVLYLLSCEACNMGKTTTTNKCKRVPDLWRPVKIKRYYAKNGRLILTTKRGKEIKQQWNYNKYNIFARYFGLKNKPSTGSKRKWMPIWAMESHMLGADQFIEFISLPMTGMRRETKLIRNAGIQIKWRCDHCSCNRNSVSNCKF